MRPFRKLHKRTKAIRARGTPQMSTAARLKYLRSMEREYDYLEARLAELLEIRRRLYDAWQQLENPDTGMLIVMSDNAQQRLHQLGKQLARVAQL